MKQRKKYMVFFSDYMVFKNKAKTISVCIVNLLSTPLKNE